MTKSYLTQKVVNALSVGLTDHGPMTVYELVDFLRGYGIDLREQVTDPVSYLRVVMYRRSHRFKPHSKVGREVRYALFSENTFSAVSQS